MRTLMLLLCLALAGCVTDGSTGDTVSGGAQASAAATSAKPDAKPETKPETKQEAAKKKDDWWKEGGVTKEKVSAMCWMKYEQGRRDIAIDARADLVNKCVADTMKANPPATSIVR